MAILTLTDEEDRGDEKAKEDILAPEMAEGIFVERIDIPHEAPNGKGGARGGQDMKNVLRTSLGLNSGPQQSSHAYKRAVTTDVIRRVCEDVDRERTPPDAGSTRNWQSRSSACT